MDILAEIAGRLAGPGPKSASEELLGRAAGEIARLRGAHEQGGVIDPWTGAWCADGKISEPVAGLDAAGRVVAVGAVDEAGTPVVATHVRDAAGKVVAVPVGGLHGRGK